MRILQVGKFYHPDKGGIETHLRALSQGCLKRADVRVIVARKPQAAENLWERTGRVDVERLPVALTAFGAPICPQLVSRLRQADDDVVHVHLPNPWAVVAYLASFCRLPLVVSYHSDVVRQSFIEPLFRPILYAFLRRASAIVCASQKLIEHSPTLQAFRERCVVIPYGIDPQHWKPVDQAKVAAIRTEHGKPVILSVGRLVYYKGFEYLIGAMKDVEASLVIVGKGPLKASLLRLASELGVSGKVTILDQVEDVQPYYHAAQIFVLPSIARSEAFGIVQLEAMAAGKPVVNTQLKSGVPFVSKHGQTGFTVAPANRGALSQAINHLLAQDELRERFGSAARKRAQQHFSLADMVSRTLEVYRMAIATAGAPSGRPLSFKAAAGK